MKDLFEQEYKKIEKSLFFLALGRLGNTEDARDVLQEAVISAYISFEKLKHTEYFKTWLTKIVLNKCRDFLRKRRYTAELKDGLDILKDIDNENLELLEAVISLDKKLSLYIILKYYNDMTYTEMSKLLKLPVSTVKYRTKKAVLKLKEIMEGDGFNEL